jgi:hypothetical protein
MKVCCATTRKGQPCTRSAKDQYCFQHMHEIHDPAFKEMPRDILGLILRYSPIHKVVVLNTTIHHDHLYRMPQINQDYKYMIAQAICATYNYHGISRNYIQKYIGAHYPAVNKVMVSKTISALASLRSGERLVVNTKKKGHYRLSPELKKFVARYKMMGDYIKYDTSKIVNQTEWESESESESESSDYEYDDDEYKA